ncbi:hypothetical protein ABKN59_001602 [Abortiporus biennis]
MPYQTSSHPGHHRTSTIVKSRRAGDMAQPLNVSLLGSQKLDDTKSVSHPEQACSRRPFSTLSPLANTVSPTAQQIDSMSYNVPADVTEPQIYSKDDLAESPIPNKRDRKQDLEILRFAKRYNVYKKGMSAAQAEQALVESGRQNYPKCKEDMDHKLQALSFAICRRHDIKCRTSKSPEKRKQAVLNSSKYRKEKRRAERTQRFQHMTVEASERTYFNDSSSVEYIRPSNRLMKHPISLEQTSVIAWPSTEPIAWPSTELIPWPSTEQITLPLTHNGLDDGERSGGNVQVPHPPRIRRRC